MTHFITTLIAAPDEISRVGLLGLLSGARFKPVPAKFEWERAVTSGKPLPTLSILILNGSMSDPAAVSAEVRAMAERTQVVVLADNCEPELVKAALCAGAFAYLPRSISAQRLLEALDLVLEGDVVFPVAAVRQVATCVVPRPDLSHHDDAGSPEATERIGRLSAREVEILNRLVHGDSNKQISRQLDISETTVKVHLKAILRKLGVRNRTQAAILGLDHLSSLVGSSHVAFDPFSVPAKASVGANGVDQTLASPQQKRNGQELVDH